MKCSVSSTQGCHYLQFNKLLRTIIEGILEKCLKIPEKYLYAGYTLRVTGRTFTENNIIFKLDWYSNFIDYSYRGPSCYKKTQVYLKYTIHCTKPFSDIHVST